jgi:hypothetical protein
MDAKRSQSKFKCKPGDVSRRRAPTTVLRDAGSGTRVRYSSLSSHLHEHDQNAYHLVTPFSMSQVIDVSSKLGEYMLKGWVWSSPFRSAQSLTPTLQVLTDRICPTTACNVPLLRSPNGAPLPSTYLCANCGKDTTGELVHLSIVSTTKPFISTYS